MSGPPKDSLAAPARPRVCFVAFTAITAGAGTEQFLVQVLRRAPRDRFELLLVETDYARFERWSTEYVDPLLVGVRRIRLSSSRRSVEPDRLLLLASRSRFLYLISAVGLLLARPGIFRAERRRNAAALGPIQNADLVYLIRNEDARWVLPQGSRALVVGSTHCDDLSGGLVSFPALRSSRLLRALFRARSRGRSGRIDSYHVTQPVFWERRLRRGRHDALIPLGVDTDLFTPGINGRESGPTRFLFVGSLDPMKGTDVLLEAWGQLDHAGMELHLAGTGPLRSQVEQRAAGDSRIHYHGILPSVELAAVYRSCDVFLFPSRFETLGLVALEALSSGLYVVASDT
ncbi:MAG: glycosyltransferase family 4 protein, partial [Thermoplasmata archaeon]|nr:glycosyltransferase family 4 protein [Thermoplasmata archaeon]